MIDLSSRLLRLVLLLLWLSCISLGKPVVSDEVSNNGTLKTSTRPPIMNKAKDILTYINIPIAVVSILGVLFGLLTWCVYKKNLRIYKWLTKSGKDNYNISRASCKYGLCFSCNIFCSSLTCCCHKCCSSKTKDHVCDSCSLSVGTEDNSSTAGQKWSGSIRYTAVSTSNSNDEDPNSAGESAEEKVLLQNTDREQKPADSTGNPRSSSSNAEENPNSNVESKVKQPLKRDFERFVPGTACPNSDRLFMETYERIVNMKASKITFRKFLSHHRRYSQFFGLMSHTKYCKNLVCRAVNHKEFEKRKGLQLAPVIYFLVLNWVELLYLFKKRNEKRREGGESVAESTDSLLQELFKFMLPAGNRDNSIVKTEWENIKSDNAKDNVWLTMLNFPEPSEIRTSDEKKLRNLLVEFMFKLQVWNANLVVRGSGYCVRKRKEIAERQNVYKSMWQAKRTPNTTDDSCHKMEFTFTLCKNDLKMYPSKKHIPLEFDKDISEFKKDRLVCYDVTEFDKIKVEVEFDVTASDDRIVSIVVKDLNVTKTYLCEIFLDDQVVGKEGLKLQSPYLLSNETPINAITTTAATSATEPTQQTDVKDLQDAKDHTDGNLNTKAESLVDIMKNPPTENDTLQPGASSISSTSASSSSSSSSASSSVDANANPTAPSPLGSTITTSPESTNVVANRKKLAILKRSQIDELAAMMDASSASNTPYWHMIADKIYEENKDRKQIIEDLRRLKYGGGNPGFKFLDILEVTKDDLTVKEFCETARVVGRPDIENADFLKNAKALGTLMCNLALALKLKLAARLDLGSGIADWEYFADQYAFSYLKKEEIKQEMKCAGKHSSSIGLIERLIKDDWTIEKFEQICVEVTGLTQITKKLAQFRE